jgi:uncharacterized protein YbaA (DUF1428 family)
MLRLFARSRSSSRILAAFKSRGRITCSGKWLRLRDTYRHMSAEWGNAYLRHGALYYSDSISEDAQSGKLTSFPQAVRLEEGEVIALAWVVYRSKEDRDRAAKAVMEDPDSRSRWTLRKCHSTASGCSGAASKPSPSSRPTAADRRTKDRRVLRRRFSAAHTT